MKSHHIERVNRIVLDLLLNNPEFTDCEEEIDKRLEELKQIRKRRRSRRAHEMEE